MTKAGAAWPHRLRLSWIQRMMGNGLALESRNATTTRTALHASSVPRRRLDTLAAAIYQMVFKLSVYTD
jgi:hypothetical protein